jgi:hypothetical protein
VCCTDDKSFPLNTIIIQLSQGVTFSLRGISHWNFGEPAQPTGSLAPDLGRSFSNLGLQSTLTLASLSRMLCLCFFSIAVGCWWWGDVRGRKKMAPVYLGGGLNMTIPNVCICECKIMLKDVGGVI